jgi:hypothetical protein
MSTALMQIPVGVVVVRRKAATQWLDYTWQPASILVGEPATSPWTILSSQVDTITYYAGSAEIELYRTETAHYRDNLAGDSSLWVVLQPAASEPPYELLTVTADPSEGESYTEAGSNIVEALPMPDSVRDTIAAFVAEHHEEHQFVKRKRTREEPEALARRTPMQDEPDGRKR